MTCMSWSALLLKIIFPLGLQEYVCTSISSQTGCQSLVWPKSRRKKNLKLRKIWENTDSCNWQDPMQFCYCASLGTKEGEWEEDMFDSQMDHFMTYSSWHIVSFPQLSPWDPNILNIVLKPYDTWFKLPQNCRYPYWSIRKKYFKKSLSKNAFIEFSQNDTKYWPISFFFIHWNSLRGRC